MTTYQQTKSPDIPKYKLIFLGDQGVGKSCILNRFMNDTFTEEYQATIGLDFQSKNYQIGGQDIHLLLYDTAGQEKFRSLIPMYTRDAHIVILVYDISSKESFEHIPDWLNELSNVNLEDVIFALVGNKNDLENQRQVNPEEGEKFAKEHNYIFHEISAKTSDGFDELFYKKLFDEMKVKFKLGSAEPPKIEEEKEDKFNIENEEPKQEVKTKKGCC